MEANLIDDPVDEKREYVRLKEAVEIDYTIVRIPEDLVGIGWEKGTTQNVSRGGLCLKTVCLKETTIQYLNREDVSLELRIHLPEMKEPLRAVGKIAWYKAIPDEVDDHYLIGLQFEKIAKQDLSRLVGFKYWYRSLSLVGLGLLVLLVITLVIHNYF